MDGVDAELAPALAEPSSAAKDEHEREEQEEQAEAFAVLGDVLTASGYEAWRREHSSQGAGWE